MIRNSQSMIRIEVTGQDKPKIVSRLEWGAKNAKEKIADIGTDNLNEYYNSIVIHHTGNANNNPTPTSIQDEQFAQGYSDIAYNFLIGQDGTIYEGRPLTQKQALRRTQWLNWHCPFR
jgi:hypothetical protein